MPVCIPFQADQQRYDLSICHANAVLCHANAIVCYADRYFYQCSACPCLMPYRRKPFSNQSQSLQSAQRHSNHLPPRSISSWRSIYSRPHNLAILTSCSFRHSLPYYLTEIAKTKISWAVADELTVDRTRCAASGDGNDWCCACGIDGACTSWRPDVVLRRCLGLMASIIVIAADVVCWCCCG